MHQRHHDREGLGSLDPSARSHATVEGYMVLVGMQTGRPAGQSMDYSLILSIREARRSGLGEQDHRREDDEREFVPPAAGRRLPPHPAERTEETDEKLFNNFATVSIVPGRILTLGSGSNS